MMQPLPVHIYIYLYTYIQSGTVNNQFNKFKLLWVGGKFCHYFEKNQRSIKGRKATSFQIEITVYRNLNSLLKMGMTPDHEQMLIGMSWKENCCEVIR